MLEMGKDDKARQTSQGEASVDVIKATAAAASAAVAFPAFAQLLWGPGFSQWAAPATAGKIWSVALGQAPPGTDQYSTLAVCLFSRLLGT